MFELVVLTQSAASRDQARQLYTDRFSFTPKTPISDTLDRTPTSFAVVAPQEICIPTRSAFVDTFWSQINANVAEATADVCQPEQIGPCNTTDYFPETYLVYNEAVALQGALNAAGIPAEVRITTIDSGI